MIRSAVVSGCATDLWGLWAALLRWVIVPSARLVS